MNISNVEVTAGLGGFLVLFGLGLVVWFLGRDLSRRLRRMRQAESLRQQAEQDKEPKPPRPGQAESDPDEPPANSGSKSPQG